MFDSIIKFSEDISYYNLILFSASAALISIQFNLNHYFQFILTLSVVLTEIICFSTLKLSKTRLNGVFLFFQISKIILIGFEFLRYFLVFILVVLIFVIILNRLAQLGGYYVAMASHLGDLVTTKLALDSLKEANPIMRSLMNLLGANTALAIMKVLLVGSLLYYTWKDIEGPDERLILKSVTFIGFSMALRNFLLLIS